MAITESSKCCEVQGTVHASGVGQTLPIASSSILLFSVGLNNFMPNIGKTVTRLELRRRLQIEAMKMACEPIRLSVAAAQHRIKQQARIIKDAERRLHANVLSVKSLLAQIKQLRTSIREEERAASLHRWDIYLGNKPVKTTTLPMLGVSSGLLILITMFPDSKQPDGPVKKDHRMYAST
ncbi:hypothetical protein FA95DRAFT_1576766 [Auriscalpium vulgare]|uniref:Uncharacterized protein n=1 Tax=Auriscalpium vulgare TaxID=40419 RepID=A0ACB8R9J7_9AGAM|nr:hypothetical protein FA95DRAFT_1576766 [Auriscalpium vulgare]